MSYFDHTLSPYERAQLFMAAMGMDGNEGHDRLLWREHAKLVSATLPPETPFPTTVTRLEVTESMTNRSNNLHGGMTATIFDCLTTLPVVIVSKEGFWQFAGVSRNLSVTYLKPVVVGEVVEIVGEVISIGKKLACVRGTMRRVRDGVVVATAIHDKVNTDPPMANI